MSSVTVTTTISRCGECQYCEHSGTLTREPVYWECHHPSRSWGNDDGANRIGLARNAVPVGESFSAAQQHPTPEPPPWCPLRRGSAQ